MKRSLAAMAALPLHAKDREQVFAFGCAVQPLVKTK
jgi:hypothetical protein